MKDSQPKYFIISDFYIRSNNRGSAALGYGAIVFLMQKGYIDADCEIVRYSFYRNPFRRHHNNKIEELDINGQCWKLHTLSVWSFEKLLYRIGLHFFNTAFRRTVKHLKLVAALNGGDGLTDIYGEKLLEYRLPEMKFAIEFGIPFVVMPQTIGPFLSDANKERILAFLRLADKIYVRDTNFVRVLEQEGLQYEKTNDLSYFMKPVPVSMTIQKPCVGINVSGLAYSNNFGNLVGQFDAYPRLMSELVKLFQSKKLNVYLIPHAYNVKQPETNNDDMVATRQFYETLEDKTNVHFVDVDLISPQVKWAISQMDFFVGTRMHANYAAIFTHIPVFGLAYSYKFKGAFEENGIYNRTADIKGLPESKIADVVKAVDMAYQEDVLQDE